MHCNAPTILNLFKTLYFVALFVGFWDRVDRIGQLLEKEKVILREREKERERINDPGSHNDIICIRVLMTFLHDLLIHGS